MLKIAIFASGSGSNAENIITYFANTDIKTTKIYCNNPNAGVIQRAQKLGVSTCIFTRYDFAESDKILNELQNDSTDFIILAGFLWLIPSKIIKKYQKKIINIHPALLPKYGGKGMYGDNVHKAVIANNEDESGITIHLVDEIYDNGEILFQARCSITDNDTHETLAAKIHELEYAHFPKEIERYVRLIN